MADACAFELTTEPGWIALADGWRVRRDIWDVDDAVRYLADHWVAVAPGLSDNAVCFEAFTNPELAIAATEKLKGESGRAAA